MALLGGCASPTAPTRPENSTSPSRAYLVEYSARIEKDLETLDRLVEQSSDTLSLTSGTRDSSRESLRGFLASLGKYRNLLEELGENLQDADAEKVRAALALGEQVHARLQEQALQLTLVDKVVESETSAAAAAPSTEAETMSASLEYRQVMQRTAALAASIDNYLNTLHQKSLIPYANVPHPADGVFHFLRLHALRDPRLATHGRYFDGAWKAWIEERREQGRFGKCIEIFQLLMEKAGEFHPDSLQPLSETLHASLEKPPELHEIEAMEKALEAVKEAAGSLRKTPPHWEAEFQRITASLLLVRSFRTEDPGVSLALALEARKLNPLLQKRVDTFVISTAETIADLYLASGQYEGGIVAFRRTLDLGAIPERDRLSSSCRELAFERGLRDAQSATEDARFGAARAALEQLGRIAESSSEKSKVRSALHAFYRAHVSRTLDKDPEAAVEIAQEMIRAFPADSTAKGKMDDVLFRLLRKSVGDLETSHRRLGPSGVLEHVRRTVAKMATSEGTEDCQRFLGEIDEVWTRQLQRAQSAGEVFSIAFDIARLKGESPDAARRAGALALAGYFEQSAARSDWDQVEACINRHLSSCPSEALPSGYREVYLQLLAHLDRRGPAAKLGRHLAIFSTTYPEEIDQVRGMMVDRMGRDTPEARSFYALLRTVAPDSEALKAFDGDAVTEQELAEALGRFIHENDLEAARLQAAHGRAPAVTEGPGGEDSPHPDAVARGSGSDPGGARPGTFPAGPPSLRTTAGPDEPAAPGPAVLVSAGGCALLLVLLTVITRVRGLLNFRWYALAALWLGVTIGFVLGSPSITASLSGRVDAPRATIDSRGSPTIEAGVAVARTPRRNST